MLNNIALSETYSMQIKTFNNTKVRSGEKITDVNRHTKELIAWVEAKLNKEIADAKKAETKQKRIAEKTQVMRFYKNGAKDLALIFELQNKIVDAKLMVVKKLQQLIACPGLLNDTFLYLGPG